MTKQRFNMFERLTWLFVLYAVRSYIYSVKAGRAVKPEVAVFSCSLLATRMGVSTSTARRILRTAADYNWGSWRELPNSREKALVMRVDFVNASPDSAIQQYLEHFLNVVYQKELDSHEVRYRATQREGFQSEFWARAYEDGLHRLEAIERMADDFGVLLRADLDEIHA